MKFDKETVLVILGSLILIGIWMQFAPRKKPRKLTKIPPASGEKQIGSDLKKEIKKTPVKSKEVIDKSPEKNVKEKILPETVKIPALPPVVLKNKLTEVEFDLNKGSIKSIKLNDYLNSDKKNNVILDKGSDPGALAIYTSDKKWQLTAVKDWEKTTPEKLVLNRTFTKNSEKFSLEQEWTLIENYQIKYKFSLTNQSSKRISFDNILVNAGSMPPMEILSGDKPFRKVQNIDLCMTANNAVVSIDAGTKDFPKGQDNSIRWLGISNKYFACLLFPKIPFKDGNTNNRQEIPPKDEQTKKKTKLFILSVSGKISNVDLDPDEKKSWEFTYYSGPKAITLLEILDPNASGIMRLGWSWFEWISQWLLKALLYLKTFCGSYGLSIILLTIIVRTIFWPITQKANSSMRRMQKLQPELKALREKYKDNQQELSRKTWQLYQENKVNPLGGCLPIFLQIPVFIALYSALSGSIELRHTSFLWATDLAQPDTIAQIMGIKINPLVLMMTLLMMVQQLLTPTAGDPVQQKMMMFMPLIMLFFFYNLPSGLTLYWTVSQIISILQLLINRHIANKEEQRELATHNLQGG